jgi:hypothetical protein
VGSCGFLRLVEPAGIPQKFHPPAQRLGMARVQSQCPVGAVDCLLMAGQPVEAASGLDQLVRIFGPQFIKRGPCSLLNTHRPAPSISSVATLPPDCDDDREAPSLSGPEFH